MWIWSQILFFISFLFGVFIFQLFPIMLTFFFLLNYTECPRICFNAFVLWFFLKLITCVLLVSVIFSWSCLDSFLLSLLGTGVVVTSQPWSHSRSSVQCFSFLLPAQHCSSLESCILPFILVSLVGIDKTHRKYQGWCVVCSAHSDGGLDCACLSLRLLKCVWREQC